MTKNDNHPINLPAHFLYKQRERERERWEEKEEEEDDDDDTSLYQDRIKI